MANILRNNVGTVLSQTLTSGVANNAYSTESLTVDNTTNKALLADFELAVVYAIAPVAGALQLIEVDYALDNITAGPTPSATMLGRVVGTFSPMATTSNTATSWSATCKAVPIAQKSKYYVFNNATGQALSATAALKAQCWTPG